MRSLNLIVLGTFVAYAHAQEEMDNMTDEFVDKLIDKLFGIPVARASMRSSVLPFARAPLSSSMRPHLQSYASHGALASPWTSHHQPQFWGQTTSSRNVAMKAAPGAKEVKALRDATGAGMMDCKKALVECDGNIEEATAYLRKKGIASAEKKGERRAGEGVVETYVHAGNKLGVMVEVNCETDFVAKNPEFKELAKSIAMQVAANPTVEVVSDDQIDEAFKAKEKEVLMGAEDMKSKPEEMREKIVLGRLGKILKEKVLLDQPYIRDPDKTVETLIKESIAKFGENIKVKRFVRYNMGGS